MLSRMVGQLSFSLAASLVSFLAAFTESVTLDVFRFDASIFVFYEERLLDANTVARAATASLISTVVLGNYWSIEKIFKTSSLASTRSSFCQGQCQH